MRAEDSFREDLIRPVHELLVEHAVRQPGRTAFEDARRTVTWAELERRTARVAGHLIGLGLERGAAAAVYLPNRVEAVESCFALTRAGAVGVPLHPRSTDAELSHLLADCGAALVITGAAQLPQVRRVLAERPEVLVVLVGDASEAGYAEAAAEGLPCWEELAAAWSLRDPTPDDLGLDEPAWILYTSGSSGPPRGVVCTQRGSLWTTASCTAPLLGLSREDRVLWPVPLHHSVGHNVCVLGVLAVGATAFLTDEHGAEALLRRARTEDSTFLVGVPATYHRLVQLARDGAVEGRLPRVCMVAGSPCPESLHEDFRESFGTALLDSYGMTETGGAITTNLPGGPYVPGSCGVPLPGLALRITRPGGEEEVPPGVEGEVRVSTPGLMLGYHGRPEETGAVLSGGWYRTGDLARQDPDGYVTITGRLKELIIRGGENIHPGEVEEVLAQAPGVADAAVAGIPHESLGEVPAAYLVPGPDGMDAGAVLDFCRERLSSFKLPEEIHRIASVPRTPAGKVARRELAERPARLLWRRPQEAVAARERGTTVAGLGLTGTGHALLGAVLELPDRDELVCTGRLTAAGGDPSLVRRVDHRPVAVGALLPELVFEAAGHLGCARLLDLRLDQPVVLPEDGGVQLRVTVGPAQGSRVRPVRVHGRRDTRTGPGHPWTLHASGHVGPAEDGEPGWTMAAWPPPGARGLGGERSVRGLRGVWRRGEELFAEVTLPDWTDRAGFGLHPALLEAALAAAGARRTDPSSDSPMTPVSWREVALHAVGAGVLRVRLTPREDGSWALAAADGAGDPVLTVRSLTLGPLAGPALETSSALQQDGLTEEVWTPAPLPEAPPQQDRWAVIGPDPLGGHAALAGAGVRCERHADLPSLLRELRQGAPAPGAVVLTCDGSGPDGPGDDGTPAADAARTAVAGALEWIRHGTDPLLDDSLLVVLLRGSAAVSAEETGAPDAAAVRGLLGSALDRAPGRFVLVDTDAEPRSWRRTRDAVGHGAPQLALREGRLLLPGTARVAPAEGTGLPAGPAGLFAGRPEAAAPERRLARSTAVPLLVTGPFAKETADLLSDRGEGLPLLPWDPARAVDCLRALLAERPSTVLFTTSLAARRATAGQRDDIDAVLRTVVDPALALTAGAARHGVQLVVFSAPSRGGLLDDAVAALLEVCARLLRRAGVHAVAVRGAASPAHEAQDLFAAAVTAGPVAVRAAGTGQRPGAAVGSAVGSAPGSSAGDCPIAGGLAAGSLTAGDHTTGDRIGPAAVAAVPRRTARDGACAPSGLRQRLAALSGAEQEQALLRLVRAELAGALGRTDQEAPSAGTRIGELGLDSLGVLSVRTALRSATGLRLSAPLLDEGATPAALARHLRTELLARRD
ncbi:AMP-binding protein [Streptomyces physcomitrii]|uniref:AMP-binding protein n=1 Tax=Streptomyces physcomitrii TaxID=2724184 RepID=A0ABX1HAE0_9ACTN|nr:AMP-binding protein [Streptomyces physcomitrii]NKI45369.1 AMP-binding protein [Streptomyces physcomitrii]